MSTIEDFQSATFAATPHDDQTVAAIPRDQTVAAIPRDQTVAAIPHDDLTVAEAWASSPLGDPAIEDGYLHSPAEVEDDLPADFEDDLPARSGDFEE
jgi:hypothetical protein